MKVKELFKNLEELVAIGAGEDEVYIVHRFSVPDKPNQITEKTQELEYTEPGDGLEHIFLLGKVDG